MATPRDLNLRHLRAVPSIIQRGSMSAAAHDIGLSQPALAQGMAKLEAQLGAQLFARRSDGMSPTEAGLAVAERVRSAFAQIQAAMRALARGRRGFSAPENLLTMTQLNGLLRLAEAGSFVGAAQATGLSQPALHRAVRDVEQLCGVPLVQRRGRGVSLTEAGRRLARGFRLAIREIAAAIEEAGPDGRVSQINIGAMPLSRAYLVPQAIAGLLAEAPAARFDVLEGSFRELASLLRDGVIDIMVGALRHPPPPDLDQQPLITDQLIVTARAGHPLQANGHWDPKALARYPWIVARAGSPMRERWEELFDSAGLTRPSAPVECGSVMTIRGILLESECLALLSPDQVALEIKAGLLIAVGGPLPSTLRTIGITTRSDWRATRLQQRFIELLHASASTRRPQFE